MRAGGFAAAAILAVMVAWWPAVALVRAAPTEQGTGPQAENGKAKSRKAGSRKAKSGKAASRKSASGKAASRKSASGKAASRKSASPKRKARAARKRKQAQQRRKALAKKRANRPRGWQWPPTPAMQAQGRECLESLTTLGVKWKRSPRRKGIATPIVVPSLAFNQIELAPTFRKPPFAMDCHLAVALAKASGAIEAAGVSELRFSSIYSYRRAIVNGKQKESLSRHSYGLAVDVYEVRDDLGETFTVKEHYADSALLKHLEEVVNETGLFRLVLSPANDPQSHSDHLHLEARIAPLKEATPSKKRRRKPRRKKNRRRAKPQPSPGR